MEERKKNKLFFIIFFIYFCFSCLSSLDITKHFKPEIYKTLAYVVGM